MKDLFNTEEKVEIAISAFIGLLNDPGWKLLAQIIDENIEVLREQLETGIENETKEDVDRLRDKLSVLRETRNMPTTMIKKLQSTDDSIPNSDPFTSVEELIKKRKT